LPKDEELEKRKTLLLNRFQWSEKWRRPWDDRWLRWYKAYRGAVPKLPKGEEDRSNLHIPYTYSTVDTVRSKLLTAVFATRPYISYVPVGANDVGNAENMETLVDSQLEKSEIIIKMYNLITDMLVYGGCPYETGWRYEIQKRRFKQPRQILGFLLGYNEVEQEIPVWDDPDFNPFPIDDLFPDPDGTSIDDCVWVIRRRFITEKELRAQEKLGIYKIQDFDELKSSIDEISKGRQDRLAAIGASHSQADVADVGSRRFEVLEMWEDNRVSTLINRRQIVRDGDNPFWHGKKPFGFAKFDPLNGEFYGMSLVEVIEYLQAELNTVRNQRIDSTSIAINRMFKVLKTAGIEPADLISRPNGIVWVDRMDDVEEFDFKPPAAEAFEEETTIKKDIQEATATYAEARGAPSEDRRTATENAIRERASSLRFEIKTMLFESFGLKRLGMFYDQLNQQFVDDKRRVRVETDSGYEWREFGPEDIAGQYNYLPSGSAIEPTLDALNHRENIMRLYEMFRDDPEIKARELKKRVFDAFGIKDSENLLKSEQEIMQEQQEAVMQAQVMQGGGEIGASIPGQIA
jgi:hypothetical protein